MYRGGMCTIPWNINKKMFCWHYSIIWYLCGFSFLFLLISFWWIWLSNAHMNGAPWTCNQSEWVCAREWNSLYALYSSSMTLFIRPAAMNGAPFKGFRIGKCGRIVAVSKQTCPVAIRYLCECANTFATSL